MLYMKLKQTLLASAMIIASATSANAFDTLIWKKSSAPGFRPWGLSTSTTTVRYGKTSERFELRAGDCGLSNDRRWNDCANDRERHELTTWGTGTHHSGTGDNVWYRFSVFWPKSNVTSRGQDTSHIQWFAMNGNRGCNPVLQLVHTPPFGLWAKGVGYEKYGTTVIPEKELKGKWHDIVVNVLWTPHDHGYVQIFVNGKRKITEFQPTLTFDCQLVHLKYGIYRWDIPSEPTPTTVTYFDGVRRGRNEDDMFKELNE